MIPQPSKSERLVRLVKNDKLVYMQKNNIKSVHFIGICGKGISALAFMFKQKGWRVTGSDEGFYEPVLGLLKKNKISFSKGYAAKNIPKDVDMIVIGKHAKLVPEENTEVAAAFVSGAVIKSLPEALGELAQKTENTIVAGSFGKSTVTSLLSWCLVQAKKDPSYFIGAVPFGFKTNAHLGKGKNFIMEGDEYPSANWDSRSKFLHLNPKNVILISGEHDHVNVFPTEASYVKPYKQLMKLLPADGLLVACQGGKNISSIIKNASCNTVMYGLDKKATWSANNINYGVTTKFDLTKNGKKIASFETSLLGEHNIENIIGVCAFILEKKLVPIQLLQKAIKSFKGISGRIDLKNKKTSDVLVYEGFGSSYPKAKSVFDALKLHFPSKKIITVFEPHTFSWRNRESLPWYDDVFDGISQVVLLPPPDHGAHSHAQLSFDEIFKAIKKQLPVQQAATEKEALKVVKQITKKGDIIVLVSSGSLLGLTQSIPKLFK